jgi:FkbM family methyltransferase
MTFAQRDREILGLLKRLEFRPRTIFDIGASNGWWSALIAQVFSDAHYHLFEPLIDHIPEYRAAITTQLRKFPNFTLHKVALGGHSGETTMSVFPNPLASTTLPIKGLPDVRQIPVPTRALDQLAREMKVPAPDIMKIDVQGAELDILMGARQMLPEVSVILAECWLWRGYDHHTPTLMELAHWVSGFGFCLWDFGDPYRDPDGVLTTIDCFFLNRNLMASHVGYRLSAPDLAGEHLQEPVRWALAQREADLGCVRADREHLRERLNNTARELTSIQEERERLSRELRQACHDQGELRRQQERLRLALAAREGEIEAIQSSKFWKLRTQWFKLKRRLGLPAD